MEDQFKPGDHTSPDNESNVENKRKTSKRGFASMDPERRKAIAGKGGRAAHERGVAHKFNSTEAREAGRKGGQAVSSNRDHMANIGRKGGTTTAKKRPQADI